MPEEKVFCQLDMPVLELRDKNDRRYYVYKDPEDFVEVDADTAQEAIQQSNIASPYKVVHILYNLDKLMEEGELIRVESINDTRETNSEPIEQPSPSSEETASSVSPEVESSNAISENPETEGSKAETPTDVAE